MTRTARPQPGRPGRRQIDPARRAAFEVLRAVGADGAYANLALAQAIERHHLAGRDAALATELANGTCRMSGTLDAVIECAAGRTLGSLQPAVVDVLRLGAFQLLAMRIPVHAAVASSVDLAAISIGERVAGLVNAIARKIAARPLDAWLDELTAGLATRDELALRHWHPRWIVDAYAELLPEAELADALAAGNLAPVPTLAVRPGLAQVDELDGEPTRYSPYGASRPGNPAEVAAVRTARAGVEDEGSQLVAAALTIPDAPAGPWLDMCAGPGGKTSLLRGLLPTDGWLLAGERQPHRARLVAAALRGYEPNRHQVIASDGTRPAWRSGSFSRVLVDAPCSGLGSLRRRPESRWRKDPVEVDELHDVQVALLASALDAVVPGGVIAYITCSPHRHETADVVAAIADRVEILDAPAAIAAVARRPLPDVTASTDPRYAQLWPHRHGTDAMFLALLRRRDDCQVGET